VATVLKLNIITGSPDETLKTSREKKGKKTEGEIPAHYANPQLSGLYFRVIGQEEIDKLEAEKASNPESDLPDPTKPREVEVDGVKGLVLPELKEDPLAEVGGPLYKEYKLASLGVPNDFILVLTDDAPVLEPPKR
jgi:hypothetical protein